MDHCLYSDEEVESDDEYEPIYIEEEDEDEIDMSHENIGFRVASKDLFHEFQGKKGNKDSRNYKQNEREIFVRVNTDVYPQHVENPPQLVRKGEGKSSIRKYKDWKAEDVADDLFNPIIKHVVKMYNVNLNLNNIDWKLEKEEAALGKKVLMKRAIAKSNVAQCVDINFSEFHDVALSEVARGKSQKVRPYICAMCKIDPPKELLSYESRTLYYCVQCSVFAEVAKRHQDRSYLHPQCFGRYHRHVYNKLIGSSSVKGIVISK